MVAELWPSIEQSAIGVAMRSSPFLYPAANVAHILGLMLFFSAVAVMDAKVLGVFPHVPAGCVLRIGRPLAVGGLLVQATSGSLLFSADAIAIAGNPAFRLKMLLVLLGLANGAVLECVMEDDCAPPSRVRHPLARAFAPAYRSPAGRRPPPSAD